MENKNKPSALIVFLVVFCIFIPLFIDSPEGLVEWIWMIHLIPVLIIAHYFGLKGGIFGATVTTGLHGIWELVQFLQAPDKFDRYDTYIVFGTAITVFVVAIGVGLLVDKFRQQQAELSIAYKQMEHMAFHDGLTDLPNRNLFEDLLLGALERAKQNNSAVAVMFLDLDRFKNINDSLGHVFGDKVLIEVAERLKLCIDGAKAMCRWGGDEFAIMLEGLTSAEDISNVAKRIITELQEPLKLAGKEVVSTVSIGISVYPNDGVTLGDLMKNADSAMQQAKENGKNAYRFFRTSMNETLTRKASIERHLRNALTNNELTVYYQPQVSLITQDIVGMEALIRWNSPELGWISPNEFIPIAEETGVIVPIGEWVLLTACKQAKLWQVQGYQPLKVSVNVSAVQLGQKDFLDSVQRVLDQSMLEPKYLQLEITESALIYQFNYVVDRLNALTEMGIEIAMDDFGTGYSSLTCINTLPIDCLKIHKDFIGDILVNSKNVALVEAIIDIGKKLNYKVIAEGVESEEQLNLLMELKCNIIQGYLFGKPQPPEDFQKLIFKVPANEPGAALVAQSF